MLDKLTAAHFQVDFRSHAEAILKNDFPEVATQIEEVLLGSAIPIEEIIGSGGGETKGTQRLRNALKARGWNKHNFIVVRTIDGVPREAQSHEVDHTRAFEAGTVALEIEWNNKDPFFDRDLENFNRLHADGAISLGIIVTRGTALQDSMKELVRRFADDKAVNSHEDMERIGLNPTRRQRTEVMKRVQRLRNPIPFREAWVDSFVSDKFGAATTHWRKLEDRVQRGVGNPCPLVLIGIPPNTVTFGEDASEVQKLLAEGEQESTEGTANSEADDEILIGQIQTKEDLGE
jgi:Restriction endonuclease BglII